MTEMTERERWDEIFWGGYLQAMVKAGVVSADTPSEEVEQMKADFMSGLRGDPS